MFFFYICGALFTTFARVKEKLKGSTSDNDDMTSDDAMTWI